VSAAAAAVLALQAVAFAVWTGLMFRTLFRLRRRAMQQGSGPVPGIGATLAGWRAFLTRPEDRTDRRRLGAVTLTMFALIGLHAWLVT